VLAEVSDEALAEARQAVEAEAVNLRIRVEQALGGGADLDAAAFTAAWEAVRASHVYLPTSRTLVPRAEAVAGGAGASAGSAAAGEYLTALQHQHEVLAATFNREQARLAKLEARVTKHTAGFEARAAKLGAALAEGAGAVNDAAISLAAFTRLAHDEAAALPARLARATAEAQEEADRERALQARYADLMREMESLREALAARRA
jgi:hypothetical protein